MLNIEAGSKMYFLLLWQCYKIPLSLRNEGEHCRCFYFRHNKRSILLDVYVISGSDANIASSNYIPAFERYLLNGKERSRVPASNVLVVWILKLC